MSTYWINGIPVYVPMEEVSTGPTPDPPQLEEVTRTYTSNGTQTITPSAGKDGISKATITVNVEAMEQEPNLETKSVTITQNGNSTITPSSGYDGIQQVNVTTNVPTSSSSLPSKIKLVIKLLKNSSAGPTSVNTDGLIYTVDRFISLANQNNDEFTLSETQFNLLSNNGQYEKANALIFWCEPDEYKILRVSEETGLLELNHYTNKLRIDSWRKVELEEEDKPGVIVLIQNHLIPHVGTENGEIFLSSAYNGANVYHTYSGTFGGSTAYLFSYEEYIKQLENGIQNSIMETQSN